jgi:hypothetical protein
MAFMLSWMFVVNIDSVTSSLHRYNFTVIQDLEILGELYYTAQMEERTLKFSKDFVSVGANFPCILGTFPIGSSSKEGILDGHKYLCGLHMISGPPIVYSYGSHRDVAFEKAFLYLRPDAKIFVFEILLDQLPALIDRDPRVTYYPIGLGGYDGKSSIGDMKVRTMSDTMRLLNHSYVDVLKMDIEGHEFLFARHELATLGPRIGQYSVEVHVNTPMAFGQYFGENTITFATKCEESNLRIFHKEVNRQASTFGIELSFIQHHWTIFEKNKRHFFPLN